MSTQNSEVPSRADLSGRATHYEFRIETLARRIKAEEKKLQAALEELARAERAISPEALKEDISNELFSKNDEQRSAIVSSAGARISADAARLGTKRKSSLRAHYITLLHTAGVSLDDNDTLDEGVVYILTNPQYSGHVKVGMTAGSPTTRASDYSTSHGFGQNWNYVHSISTRFYRQVERIFHQSFADRRVVVPSPNGSTPREIYALDVEAAKSALHSIGKEIESNGGEVMTLLAVLDGKFIRVPADPSAEDIQREIDRRLHPDIVSARQDEISEIRRDIAILIGNINEFKLELSSVEKENEALGELMILADRKVLADEEFNRKFRNYSAVLIVIAIVAYFAALYLSRN